MMARLSRLCARLWLEAICGMVVNLFSGAKSLGGKFFINKHQEAGK